MTTTRRDALQRFLLGSAWLGLRSLASGIPASVLLNPALARAQSCDPRPAKYLLLASSKGGDPVNCNVPGTYDDPGVIHAADPSMAATPMLLGQVRTTGAKIWSTLPQTVLNRTTFFHHSTLTNNHANHSKVMGLMQGKEMLPSLIARETSKCLMTIQREPLSLGATDPGEALSYEGRPQPNLSPTTLKNLFTTAPSPLGRLQAMRDADLNRLNGVYRAAGNRAQRDFLDRWATSQAQARNLETSLLQGLSTITDDSPKGQAIAAAVLFKLKVTPVLTMHIPFGGDNHEDLNLAGEVGWHASGVAAIAEVMSQLAALQLQDSVNFAMLNVFGRELAPPNRNGRSHLADHHCAVLIGPSFKPGVIGGIVPTTDDYAATGINPITGASSMTGVPRLETLAAMAKTLNRAMGVSDAVNNTISGGQVIQAALV